MGVLFICHNVMYINYVAGLIEGGCFYYLRVMCWLSFWPVLCLLSAVFIVILCYIVSVFVRSRGGGGGGVNLATCGGGGVPLMF